MPLGSDESIFSNPDSLEPDFVPKLLPFRENEQKEIALALEPLLSGISGRNLFIYGKTGIGKSHAVLRVLEDFSEQGLICVFVNCWVNSDSQAILAEIARKLAVIGEPNIQRIKSKLNVPCALAFDEIDHAKDLDFLYALSEEIKVKSIIAISNKREFLASLDDRIRSRLMLKQIEFRDYKEDEMAAILAERRKYAFYEETWHKDAIALLEEKTIEKKDIRFGLALMKHAGLNAEREASRVVFRKHVALALDKVH